MEGFFASWPGCPNGSFISYKRTWAATVRSLELVVSPIVKGVSLLACVLTIVTIVRIKDDFKKARGLLGILTIFDFVFLALSLTEWYNNLAHTNTTVNQAFVLATTTAKSVCMGMSSAMLVVVTIQRVLYIKRPHSIDQICTTPRYIATIVMSFILVFAVSIGFLIGALDTSLRDKPMSERGESTTNVVIKIMNEMQKIIFFIIPLIVLVFGNIIILRELKQIFKRQKQLSSVHSKREQQNMSAIIIIVLLFVAFCVTVIPYLVFYYYLVYRQTAINSLPCSRSEEYGTYLYTSLYESNIYNMILSINPFLNFLMYILSSKRYRDAIKALIYSPRCCKQLIKKPDQLRTTASRSTDMTKVSEPSTDAKGR